MSNEPRTYVVLGIFCGGTSAVAGALRILGVDMGSEERDHQHEDQVMQHAQLDMDAWKQRIQNRNAEGKTWGFKQPNTVRFFDELEPYFENPKYILVYRDKEAVADSEEKYIGLDKQKSYDRTDWWYKKMTEIAENNLDTSSVFYYEKLTDPEYQEAEAKKLYEFVKGNYPKTKNKMIQRIMDFWSSDSYMPIEDLKKK